jgi:hypothetical protein
MLVELATKHGLGSANYDELFGPGKTIMYGDWIKVGLDRGERRYEELLGGQGGEGSKVVSVLEEYLEEYNLAHTNALNLVFFMDAVEHIARIARILRQPRGNALLVSERGRSAARRARCLLVAGAGFEGAQGWGGLRGFVKACATCLVIGEPRLAPYACGPCLCRWAWAAAASRRSRASAPSWAASRPSPSSSRAATTWRPSGRTSRSCTGPQVRPPTQLYRLYRPASSPDCVF